MTQLHVLGFDPTALPAHFWRSEESELLVMESWARLHPTRPLWLRDHLPKLVGHVWLATSGTLAASDETKWVAISKRALLVAAQGANAFLQARSSDGWGLALPLAHVAGLAILARSHLLGQRVDVLREEAWRPERLQEWRGEFLSLVPTQLHDLVALGVKAPATLKAVVVGGDRLSEALQAQALELGWPVRASFGVSECGSQIATAPAPTAPLELLPHVQAFCDEEGRLFIDSPALFSGYALCRQEQVEWQPRAPGAWASQDRARLHGRELTVLGRLDSVVKVRGEKVDLSQLEKALGERLGQAVVVLARPAERDGSELVLLSEKPLDLTLVNQGLLAHQRFFQHHQLAFPRTALGKIKRGELAQWLLGQGR